MSTDDLLRRVVTVSVTEAGRRLAARLPYEAVHGAAGAAVPALWPDVGGLVLFLATGAAVRIVAPLLAGKHQDPAVVCVDEAGRFAVALVGGHAGGANDLARRVAALLGAEAVVTTATDAAGLAGLDTLPGWSAAGEVAAVTAALLDGRPVVLDDRIGWPLPDSLAGRLTPGAGPDLPRLVVTDSDGEPDAGTAVLRPPSLVAGIGTSTGATAAEVAGLLAATLAGAGLWPGSVAEIATIDRRAASPAVMALGHPVRSYPPEVLATVAVPSPSETVRSAVGTPSVAEAAALLAAGPDSELVVSKRAGPTATVAIARRGRPRGRLSLVGLGPGGPGHRTPAAETAVRSAGVVIGYGPYLDQCADLRQPGQRWCPSPIGAEVDRAREAWRQAAEGRRVALVCSGDAGVYGMASVALEQTVPVGAEVEVEVVPGVTAALAAAALVGAPLGHDHAAISLSDLLTPWPVVESRLRAAAAGDFVVSLYNPRSAGRTWQLEAARDILAGCRPPATPVAVVTDAGRPGQRALLTTLGDLDPAEVGMTTCVIVGAANTTVIGGRMVTPRGYRT